MNYPNRARNNYHPQSVTKFMLDLTAHGVFKILQRRPCHSTLDRRATTSAGVFPVGSFRPVGCSFITRRFVFGPEFRIALPKREEWEETQPNHSRRLKVGLTQPNPHEKSSALPFVHEGKFIKK